MFWGISLRAVSVFLVISSPAFAADASRSKKALETLRADPKSVTQADVADVPLTKGDAAEARRLLWDAHVARIKAERAAEMRDSVIKQDKLEMKFSYKTFGDKPKTGRSLYISMHGGGGAPARVNDQQWENQKKLYTVDEGIYLAPRAPTNTWNLWHESHIDTLFARLIEDLIVFEGVNPDRVYLLGYSAGGDGVYKLAPRMADHWAAAAMMAGHPNGVPLKSLRNVPFALQVGGKDAAYDRNKVGKQYGEELDKLEKADPGGYKHFVKIHEDKPHWMGGEDKVALPWMAKFDRDPVPTKVVWQQSDTPRQRSYWLAVPAGQEKNDSLVVVERKGQAIDIVTAEKVDKLLIRLDGRMVDLDQPVRVTHAGKTLYDAVPPRTIGTLAETLKGRGDPKLMFEAEIAVELK